MSQQDEGCGNYFFHKRKLLFFGETDCQRRDLEAIPGGLFFTRHDQAEGSDAGGKRLSFYLVGQDHHPIGEAGVQLSQGEKDLIAIRAGHEQVFGQVFTAQLPAGGDAGPFEDGGKGDAGERVQDTLFVFRFGIGTRHAGQIGGGKGQGFEHFADDFDLG